jgi:site-specific recombinase XerD
MGFHLAVGGDAVNRKRVLPKHCGYFTDVRGKQRLRFRKRGCRTVYPSALPGTHEFLAEYQTFLGNALGVPKSRNVEGTVSAVVSRFYCSAEFKVLATGTQAAYRGIFERFRRNHGSKKIASIQTIHVNSLIDEMADKPAAAKHFRLRLKALMDFAIGAGYRTDNPVLMAKRVKHKDKGIRPWTEQDIIDFRLRWSIQTPQRIAFEILLHTGLRRSDAVKLGRQHVREYPDGDRFVIKTKKSQETVELVIPQHPTLRSFIAQIPASQLTYIMTAHGAPRSEKAFTNWIREAAAAAGLPVNSSPHGLRKAACRRLADAGCDAFQIQAITGHKNLAEVQVYVQDRDQRLRASVAMNNYAKSFPQSE